MGDDRPATKEELLGFFEHIEAELERLGFFNPPHKRADGGAKSAHDVLAHGRHGAGSPHPPWYCCNAGEGQGTCSQAVNLSRHYLAKF